MLPCRFGPYENSVHLLCFGLNTPYIIGLPFLQTVNPIIDWMNHSVQVFTVLGLCYLEIISLGFALQNDIICSK